MNYIKKGELPKLRAFTGNTVVKVPKVVYAKQDINAASVVLTRLLNNSLCNELISVTPLIEELYEK